MTDTSVDLRGRRAHSDVTVSSGPIMYFLIVEIQMQQSAKIHTSGSLPTTMSVETIAAAVVARPIIENTGKNEGDGASRQRQDRVFHRRRMVHSTK